MKWILLVAVIDLTGNHSLKEYEVPGWSQRVYCEQAAADLRSTGWPREVRASCIQETKPFTLPQPR